MVRPTVVLSTLAALLVLLVPTVCSVKIGYHGINFSDRSQTIDTAYVGEQMGSGHFSFDSDIAVPFPTYDGGKGAVGIVRSGSSSVSLMVVGPEGPSFVPSKLFWDNDADGDGAKDIVITDMEGRLYVLNDSAVAKDVHLAPDDARLTGLNGSLRISDISGDGISDVIGLSELGTRVLVIEGPLDAPSGSYELELPFGCELLDAGPDLNGDGLLDLVLAGRDGGTYHTLLAFDGASLSQIASMPLPGSIRSLDHGDINGDGLDDLLLLMTDGPPNGSMLIIFGEGVRGTALRPELTWSIEGDGSAVVHGGIITALIDLDGDLCDDIVLGDPSWDGGRGRLSLFYGGSELDFSTDRSYAFPDADLLGSGPTSGLGGLILTSRDHDHDMLPDVFVNNGETLARWELPRNYPPDGPLVLKFVKPGTDAVMERAQLGDTIGIRLVAKGGGASYPDSVRVNISSLSGGARPSWALLKETGADTSLYTGSIRLTEGTIPGRSMAAIQDDGLVLWMGALRSGPLHIKGYAGQDDPPYIEAPKGPMTAVEGKPFSLRLIAYDPDDDPIEWSIMGTPVWATFEEGLLSGTPSDGDVGTYELTVTVTAGAKNATLGLTIEVRNMPPKLEPQLLPNSAVEGQLYRGMLSTDGSFGPLLHNGNGMPSWLKLLPNGSLLGTPRNKDVLRWTFNATAADLNGANTSIEWTVLVENAPPKLTLPPLSSVKWGSELLLDLDCPDEGDGLTLFFLQGAPEGMTIDRITGVLNYTVPYGSDNLTFKAGVSDGHGASVKEDVFIEVVPLDPILRTMLPSLLRAGELLSLDLDAEGEGGPLFEYRLANELPFVHRKGYDPASGRFSLRPWNMDKGEYTVDITFGPMGGKLSSHRWDFTVVGNESFSDPSLGLSLIGRSGSSIRLRIEGDNGTLPLIGSGLTISDKDQVDVRTITLDQGLFGVKKLDLPGPDGPFNITVEMVIGDINGNSRSLRGSLMVEPETPKKGDGPSLLVLAILAILAVMLTLGALGALLMVERTSYRLRTLFASGSSTGDEVILSAVQRHPGIRFGELQERMRMGSKELVLGLMSLTGSGHIRAVPDGPYIRFLPTVGSFVKGPLALDRDQGAVLDLLKGGEELTASEISNRSGIPERTLKKELNLLELKDAVSSKGKGAEKRFYLDRRQKARLSSWARSGRQR